MTQSSSIPEHPCLKANSRVAFDDESGRLLIRDAHSIVAFEGGAARWLLPALVSLLDGTRSMENIHAAMGEHLRPATDNALRKLTDHGLLSSGIVSDGRIPRTVTEAVSSTSPNIEGWQGDARRALEIVASSTVAVLSSGPLATEVTRLLRISGVRTEDVAVSDISGIREAGYSAVVVVASSPDDIVLKNWNEKALEVGQPWMQILPYDGAIVVVGPFYVPGETACHECFRIRRAANTVNPEHQSAWDQVVARAGGVAERVPMSPSLVSMSAGLAVHVLLESIVLAGITGAYLGGFLQTVSPDLQGLEVQSHRLYRVPRCPTCSPARAGGQPLPWFHPVEDEGPSDQTAPLIEAR